MYNNKLVAVVVPCYNEESQIEQVIATIPDYIDAIVVIDDVSRDNTVKVIERAQQGNPKVVLIKHDKNQGVGGAIASGYKWARDNNMDIAVVMAGDGQMDPDELPKLIEPIVNGETDYTKTNRLFYGDAFNQIPKVRYFGNSILSLLTKIASGYWHIADSQSGYTAIGKEPLQLIDWDKMYKRYGQPNDLLVRLNIYNFRVRDIITKPVYNVGEKSKMKVHHVVFTIGWLLIKQFFFRLKEKYIIRDFHPLVFFYFFGFSLMAASIPLFVRIMYFWIAFNHIPKVNFLAWMFAVIMGIQFILFAMWFDMDNNKHLR
ncbi:MAG: glycosyltransferase family 2 protein [Bacteroidales bacterium]|nr:glycosyltransferase family 2 protein [Bacteroidales bacterium]MBN2748854.1 glycosyltransferase family 2 protein [Bacteroidales bacterium]